MRVGGFCTIAVICFTESKTLISVSQNSNPAMMYSGRKCKIRPLYLLTSIPATCRRRGRGNTSARVNISGVGFPRCRGKSKIAAFTSALDACVPNAAQEAINHFNQWWNDIRFDTYVTSISEHDDSEDLHGRLSMWRAFGGNIVRVALVFKVPRFSQGSLALNLLFSPVAYLTEEETNKVIQEVIQNIAANCSFLRQVDRNVVVQSVFYMLIAAVTCLKHEGFREEREWRAIYTPKLRPSPLMESSIETVLGIPQLVHKIPLDATVSQYLADLDFTRIFDRLLIGPSSYPWVMFDAFTQELSKAGISDASNRVQNSNIPIRT